MANIKNNLELVRLYDHTPKEVINKNIDLICGPKSEFAPINADLRSKFMMTVSNAESRHTIFHWWRPYGDSYITRTRVPLESICRIAEIFGELPETFMKDDDRWYVNRKDVIDKLFVNYMDSIGQPIQTVANTHKDKVQMALNHLNMDIKHAQNNIVNRGLGKKTFTNSMQNSARMKCIKAKTSAIFCKAIDAVYKEKFTAADGETIESTNPDKDGFEKHVLEFLAEHGGCKEDDLISFLKTIDVKTLPRLKRDELSLSEKEQLAEKAGGKFDFYIVFPDGKEY